MTQPTLLYFADPMCSWCWGFSPVIEALREKYHKRLKIALILGGLRPGTQEPLSAQAREEILQHWQAAQERSAQPFNFEHALAPGFIYDTEPASRAVLSFAELNAPSTLAYFKRVQQAFYLESQDVSQIDVLTELTQAFEINADEFRALFISESMRKKTQLHFLRSRQLGVTGFPTLVLQQGEDHHLLSNGYCEYETLDAQLQTLLASPT